MWFIDTGILHESGSPEILLSGRGKTAEFYNKQSFDYFQDQQQG
jgi:hypothetical protein